MKRKNLFVIFALAVCFNFSLVNLCLSQTTEELIITTYYPAPYGVYNQLLTNRLAIGDVNGDGSLTVDDLPGEDGDLSISRLLRLGNLDTDPIGVSEDGSIYYNTTTNELRTYISGAWTTFSSLWERTAVDPNNIHNINTGYVGIGTSSPLTKLDVRGKITVGLGLSDSSAIRAFAGGDKDGIYGSTNCTDSTGICAGVRGMSTDAWGVIGASVNSIGTYGKSINNTGIWAGSDNGNALRAEAFADGHGVIGISNSMIAERYGVWAYIPDTSLGHGLHSSGGAYAGYFDNGTGSGLYAQTDDSSGYAIHAEHPAGTAILAESATPDAPTIDAVNSTGSTIRAVNSSAANPTIFARNSGVDGVAGYFDGRIRMTACCATKGVWGDIAEIIPTAEDVEPGDIVIINPNKERELIRAEQAYDDRVAGVISADPWFLIGDKDEANKTEPDKNYQYLTLAGQVECKVDTSYGEIKPGDWLTTSPTPGHAMRVKDKSKAVGTIIGKALEGLNQGKGKILILIN